MPVSRELPPLPNVAIPIIDLATGKLTPQWANYFTLLDSTLREMRSAI